MGKSGIFGRARYNKGYIIYAAESRKFGLAAIMLFQAAACASVKCRDYLFNKFKKWWWVLVGLFFLFQGICLFSSLGITRWVSLFIMMLYSFMTRRSFFPCFGNSFYFYITGFNFLIWPEDFFLFFLVFVFNALGIKYFLILKKSFQYLSINQMSKMKLNYVKDTQGIV